MKSESELSSVQLTMHPRSLCTLGVSRNSLSWTLWTSVPVSLEIKPCKLSYSVCFWLYWSPYRTLSQVPEDQATDIQATEHECPWGMQQQLTAFPALTLNSIPQFSGGHLHCTMSAPLANTFSESRLGDFKQEFPKEPDALPEGAKSPVLDKWYIWYSDWDICLLIFNFRVHICD